MHRVGALLISLLVASPTLAAAQSHPPRPSFEHVHALAFDAAGASVQRTQLPIHGGKTLFDSVCQRSKPASEIGGLAAQLDDLAA